jgi:hypothetical protein
VTHFEHGGYVGHRHVFPVGITDGLIAFLPQLLRFALQLALPFGVGLGEGLETLRRLRGFSFGPGDLMIVGRIPANRLA